MRILSAPLDLRSPSGNHLVGNFVIRICGLFDHGLDSATMKRKMTAAEQSAEFKRMARELGADESPKAFDSTLKRIAPGKPAPPPVPRARKKK